jgi:hypothetical protein
MRLLEVIKGKAASCDLEIEEGLEFPEDKFETAKSFIDFCCQELRLTGDFKCLLCHDRDKNGVVTTAFYRDKDKFVCVYAKNRMLGDLMRSVAHEMVHKKQYEDDRIVKPVQDIGGEIEDEANAVAGQLVKKFIKTQEMGKNLFESVDYINSSKLLL